MEKPIQAPDGPGATDTPEAELRRIFEAEQATGLHVDHYKDAILRPENIALGPLPQPASCPQCKQPLTEILPPPMAYLCSTCKRTVPQGAEVVQPTQEPVSALPKEDDDRSLYRYVVRLTLEELPSIIPSPVSFPSVKLDERISHFPHKQAARTTFGNLEILLQKLASGVI